MATKDHTKNQIVLVGVIKCEHDLDILMTKKWYRIPKAFAPVKKFTYLAFYQPAIFGKQGRRIQYYARVLNHQTTKRINLLPDESDHPRAKDNYTCIDVGNIKKLSRPIKNIIPRRVIFGFTTLERLLKSKDILQLYRVAPIEQIFKTGLRRAKIKVISQYYVLINKRKRYRLDFAIFCQRGQIAIECDNKKAHSGSRILEKDKRKNIVLEKLGWTVIRLREQHIIFDPSGCIAKVKKTIQKLGGIA